MELDKVIEFAKSQGYDGAEELGEWEGYDAYEPVMNGDDPAVIGLPLLILVKGNKIRMSTQEEAFQQIDSIE